MGAPITLVADDWTQIAAAGFGSAILQLVRPWADDHAVMIEMSATKPSVADSGTLLFGQMPVPYGHTDASRVLWGRPQRAGFAVVIRNII